jgi:penicillin-binding protein 2
MAGLRLQSMFHRRLLVLASLIALAMALLIGQLARLTLASGDELLAEAERALVSQRWIETQRGRILDREGRPLAVDRPSFDVEAHYSVITGSWAYSQAARDARTRHADEWGKLGDTARDALVRQYLPARVHELEMMWRRLAEIAGVEREELDARRNRIVERTQKLAASVWEARRLKRLREWSRSRDRSLEPPTLADVARPIREQASAHRILRGVRDEAAFEMRKLAEANPELLRIVDGGRRRYPFEAMDIAVDRRTFPRPLRSESFETVTVRGVATHALGWMRDRVFAEDLARRPRVDPATGELDLGHYREGDSVGSAGVEASHEDHLRGQRGQRRLRLDTGAVEAIEPTPGEDLTLTIDVRLQARILAAMDPELGLTRVQPWHGNRTVPLGEELAAAAVALDVSSGEILAMASSPTFDRERIEEDPDSVFRDPLLAPWVNRAVARPYPAASIVKPLVLVEAVTREEHELDHPIECTGHFFPNLPGKFRCWIYRPRYGMSTHSSITGGPLGAPEALARSCNIYFYTLGQALGGAGTRAFYESLGVTRPYDLGLPGASAGFLGYRGRERIEPNEAIMMAIGQGPISWTPLHAADAYATLARRGLRIEPSLIRGRKRPDYANLGWDAEAVDAALAGLEAGVDEPYGTAHHITYDTLREPIFNVPGVRVMAKTGTGQASATLGEDPDGDGPQTRPVIREGTHAWTVALVGAAGGPPEYAIAVVVEHGGPGGRVAGPIANQIIWALQAEGYLPGGDGDGPGGLAGSLP